MSDKLTERSGLPDALTVLLDEYPRDLWAQDPGFHGLVSFWLDRHIMFRKLLAEMSKETQSVLDGGAPQRFAQSLSHYGSMFVQQLHGHHQIEDAHYFPLLSQKDARLERGFEILDRDHHDLDGLLAHFVDGANLALGELEDRAKLTDNAGRFEATLAQFSGFIARHLNDEEDLIVPVILKYGADGLG